MAFRNFLDTEYVKKILKDFKDKDYTPIKITNMKFDDFTAVWKEISEKIMKDLGSSDINKVSKLISTIMIEETDIKNISELLKIGNKAVILWGPPGTGKTYESMEVVKEILELKDGEKDEDIEQNYLFSKKGEPDNEKGYYEIIQFHPNYTYEDFIGGISPKIDGSKVSYELREGIFYKFCKAASDKPKQKYIFIIDEINRAELSAVFGELLFALEYRGKSINLPHFGSFTIPENVYIIGTMNNVDKSLVTFDLALRRRFGFFKLMPKLDVLLDVLGDIVEEESLKRYVEKCKKLNEDMVNELSLGEDYQIGQAYFLKIKDFLKENKEDKKVKITSFDLERLWVYNIEPLLEEYLGMSMDDDEIKNELTKLKESFETDDIKS
ncbi:MAG TPA: AAA family ATPase [Sulfurospirillum arcachonense]|nr:AAA family ATPase [Sulfurospirillum arcachonense]